MIDARHLSVSSNFSRPQRTARYKIVRRFKLPILLSALHIPLGILLYNFSILTVIHPLAVFAVGLYFAFRKNEPLERTAWVAAYLIGIEVLWRMAHSPVFWEFSKYAAATIMIVALIQRGYYKVPFLPLLYLLFLTPACILTVLTGTLGDAKDAISYNMSGPFFLVVSCWFFSHLKVNETRLKKFLLMMVVPLISVAVTTLFYTLTTENITFNDESNFATSGGFGPNQVSSLLGLGVFVCLLLFLSFKNNFSTTVYLISFALLFATQSVLTFSRGGMYNTLGAITVVVLFQTRSLTQVIRRLLPILAAAVIFIVLIFPSLNSFTGGSLQDRFEDTDPTGRTEIINADYQIFLQNPIIGVGVGNAEVLRGEYFYKAVASHTEFARVISEHGALGILALIALALGVVFRVLGQNSGIKKGFVAGVVLWSALFMMNAGMRLAAPSFMWGLSFLTIVTPPSKKRLPGKSDQPKIPERVI